jgi:hypothetical protein
VQYLKTKTLVGPYEHVLRDDPALDQKAAGFQEAYDRAIETGDFSKVPRADGQEPAVWTLRHLTAQQWRFVQDVHDRVGLNSALLEAFALGLVEVKGVPGFELERAPDPKRRGWEAVRPEQLEQFTGELVNEIGGRAVAEKNPRNG